MLISIQEAFVITISIWLFWGLIFGSLWLGGILTIAVFAYCEAVSKGEASSIVEVFIFCQKNGLGNPRFKIGMTLAIWVLYPILLLLGAIGSLVESHANKKAAQDAETLGTEESDDTKEDAGKALQHLREEEQVRT